MDQVFQFLKAGIENEAPNQTHPDKKFHVKRIGIINDDTVICEFYPYAKTSGEIKIEIGFIMSLFASFWEENPHVPKNIQNFAIKAFSGNDEELMYAISSREIAELMCEGKSIEWLQNTIFQDNSDDHHVSIAKRQISEIENALRKVIPDVLEQAYGMQWWDHYVASRIRNSARSAYRNQTGITSSDGRVLLSFTYLLQLKRIITDNWSDFSHIFRNRTTFETWLDGLNDIRRDEAHNRPISNTHIANLQQIYNGILKNISEHYPEAVSGYLSENWRQKIIIILDDYLEKQNQLPAEKELGLDHNMATVMTTISDLSDVEIRLSSIPVPPNKHDLHDELTDLILSLRDSFEEMIECGKAGNVEGVKGASKKNEDIRKRMRTFTEKILLGS